MAPITKSKAKQPKAKTAPKVPAAKKKKKGAATPEPSDEFEAEEEEAGPSGAAGGSEDAKVAAAVEAATAQLRQQAQQQQQFIDMMGAAAAGGPAAGGAAPGLGAGQLVPPAMALQQQLAQQGLSQGQLGWNNATYQQFRPQVSFRALSDKLSGSCAITCG